MDVPRPRPAVFWGAASCRELLHSLHTSQGACEVLTRWMRGVVGRGQAQEIRHTSAQAVGTIALIDLPAKQWDDLLPFLVSGVSSEQPALRQGCLLAIGTCAS
jgi:hypothetical protein